MLLHIVARGRIGRSPEAELVERYVKRLSWPYKLTELPDTGGKMPSVEPGCRIVMLDETGQVLPSRDLAATLEKWRDFRRARGALPDRCRRWLRRCAARFG